MNAFDLAPAAVVRVAGWPLDALEQFAAPDLAAQAASVDAGDAVALAAYEDAYRQTLEGQRWHLWQVTAGDPRFRCAVALSSPSLASQLKDGTPPARRNKRTRHLEKSLYRYLARAAARIEPYGLWTGVTLAEFRPEETTCVSPCAPRTHFAPELGPFRALLRAMGQREPYRSRGPYRLNPTLQVVDEQRWCYARRKTDGRLCWRDLPPSSAWKVLQGGLASLPPASLPEFRRRLAELLPAKVAGPLLDFALEAGLLVGGLQLPAQFESPWDALEQTEARLEGPEGRAWSDARGSIERTCEQLERYIDALLSEVDAPESKHRAATAAEPVFRANTAVREAIEALARALLLPCPAMPHSVLRCDLAAPFRIQLGQGDRQRLISLLEDWAHLEKQYGAAKRYELRTRRVLQARGESRGLMAVPTDHGSSRTDTPIKAPTRDVLSFNGRLDDTSEVVIPVHADAGVEVGPPLGALV
jgi:hypothetical protein